MIVLEKKRYKYRYKCDGDCWTSTGWKLTKHDATIEWNNMEKRKPEEET